MLSSGSRLRFLEKRFREFRFLVLVWFPRHLALKFSSEDFSRASTRKICPKWGPRKSHKKGPNIVFQADEGHEKATGKVTSKNATRNEKSSDFGSGQNQVKIFFWSNQGDRQSTEHKFSQKTADFRRLSPSPGNTSIWRAQETADFRRKAQIFAENRMKPQIGLRHLRCVTFGSALNLNQVCGGGSEWVRARGVDPAGMALELLGKSWPLGAEEVPDNPYPSKKG